MPAYRLYPVTQLAQGTCHSDTFPLTMGNLFPEVAGYQATTGPGLSNEVPTSTAVLYSDHLESLPAD